LQVRLLDMRVTQGGRELVVAQQFLQGGQVGAVLQQVGGETVPQRVHARLLAQAGGAHGAVAQTLHLPSADVPGRPLAGEQPLPGSMGAPVLPQALQQHHRQGHQAILVALGSADVQDHAAGVDVADLQADDLADAQAGGVSGLQDQQVKGIADGSEEAAHLVATEHTGERFGLLAEGNQGQLLGALQGNGVEETQGADGLVETRPRGLLGEQMQLVEANVFGVELLGRAAEVLGEACDVGDIGGDGPGGVVAALQVLGEALP
jgi:hypothetical protein